MNDLTPFLIPGILFLFTLGFGIWVARRGKPYHQILFNLHKLIALGGVILVVRRVIELGLLVDLRGWVLVSLVGTALAVISLFATGAIMSIREDEIVATKWYHRGSLALLLISSALAVYWMI